MILTFVLPAEGGGADEDEEVLVRSDRGAELAEEVEEDDEVESDADEVDEDDGNGDDGPDADDSILSAGLRGGRVEGRDVRFIYCSFRSSDSVRPPSTSILANRRFIHT
ncbi:MAG: hypothetical protein JWR21_3468 [Herminiimonas sp.]|nr:hypothetical protein [Herminiimonas sp.]